MAELTLHKERKQAQYFTEYLVSEQPDRLIRKLTRRERDVWTRHSAGQSDQEVATELFITVNTVKKHLKSIHQKRLQLGTEPQPDGIPLDMVLIPSGTFLMGSPADEPERNDDEGPQRKVTVPAFFMGRYPVTQAQWRFVAGLPEVNQSLKADPSEFKGDSRPVESITWYDAVEFCDRLSRFTENRSSAHTSRKYRLPSEAEWEYACRAGTTTPFYFGSILTADVANYDGNYTYNGSPEGKYRAETISVDELRIANGFGLCDMHGNVLEWCQDHYHPSYEDAPTNGSAWVDGNAEEDARRILRGGSWNYVPRLCRSAYRISVVPRGSGFNFGFRIVCSAPRALQ